MILLERGTLRVHSAKFTPVNSIMALYDADAPITVVRDLALELASAWVKGESKSNALGELLCSGIPYCDNMALMSMHLSQESRRKHKYYNGKKWVSYNAIVPVQGSMYVTIGCSYITCLAQLVKLESVRNAPGMTGSVFQTHYNKLVKKLQLIEDNNLVCVPVVENAVILEGDRVLISTSGFTKNIGGSIMSIVNETFPDYAEAARNYGLAFAKEHEHADIIVEQVYTQLAGQGVVGLLDEISPWAEITDYPSRDIKLSSAILDIIESREASIAAFPDYMFAAGLDPQKTDQAKKAKSDYVRILNDLGHSGVSANDLDAAAPKLCVWLANKLGAPQAALDALDLADRFSDHVSDGEAFKIVNNGDQVADNVFKGLVSSSVHYWNGLGDLTMNGDGSYTWSNYPSFTVTPQHDDVDQMYSLFASNQRLFDSVVDLLEIPTVFEALWRSLQHGVAPVVDRDRNLIVLSKWGSYIGRAFIKGLVDAKDYPMVWS